MTVKELMDFLQQFPEDMEVVMQVEAGQVIIGISKDSSGIYDNKVYLVESN